MLDRCWVAALPKREGKHRLRVGSSSLSAGLAWHENGLHRCDNGDLNLTRVSMCSRVLKKTPRPVGVAVCTGATAVYERLLRRGTAS